MFQCWQCKVQLPSSQCPQYNFLWSPKKSWHIFHPKQCQSPWGTLSTYAYGGQSEKFIRNPKILFQLHCNPKISANLQTLTVVNKHQSPEKMLIEPRIASTEHRNISLTMFYSYDYVCHNVSKFRPKNITFEHILIQKYRTYLPVCKCAECPPRGFKHLLIL